MFASPLSNNKPIFSPVKYVCLSEWWLAKPHLQRQGLAVGGVAYGERERVFLSTVIAKRYEANVLETEDGVTIQLRGFINSSRTSQNGFPSNVCEDFLLGFPDDWKKYTAHSFGDKCVNGVTGFGKSNACSQKRTVDALLFSIHDNHLTETHDSLLSNNGALKARRNICNGPGNSFGNVSKQSVSTDNMECSNTMRTAECECKDNTTSLKSSQPLLDMMDNGEDGLSDVAVVSQAGNPKNGQSLRGVYDPNPCTGLPGKSMVGSPISTKKFRKGQLSSDCKEKHVRRKDAGKTCSKMVTRSISKRSHTLLREEEKVTVTSVGPVRRSPRLYNSGKRMDK